MTKSLLDNKRLASRFFAGSLFFAAITPVLEFPGMCGPVGLLTYIDPDGRLVLPLWIVSFGSAFVSLVWFGTVLLREPGTPPPPR